MDSINSYPRSIQRCSKKAYAMCKTRHLCGPIDEAVFTENSECADFNREVENMSMSTFDLIRTMGDGEIAEVLVGFFIAGVQTASRKEVSPETRSEMVQILNELLQQAEAI